MKKRGGVINLLAYKRFNTILDFLEKEEIIVYNKILKLEKIKLDRIKKKEFKFPEDIFPLENSPIEWWYFSGHLKSGKKKFGIEFCFFKVNPGAIRMGVIPLNLLKKEPFLVLHQAITDKDKKKFTYSQKKGVLLENKFRRGLALNLEKESLVWKNGFSIKSEFFDLFIKPKKKIILHYNHGFKQYKFAPTNRTYYVSFTRMDTKGFIIQNGKKYPVKGKLWFDHQKSTLPEKQVLWGWDWTGIMLDDGTELMVTGLRRQKDFKVADLSGSYITKNSKKVNLKKEEIEFMPLDSWKSEKTGIIYPSKWNLKIKKLGLDLTIIPCVKNQELDFVLSAGVSYWEGACEVSGKKNRRKIKGEAYVELVGYDTRLLSKFIRKLGL